MNFLNYFVNHSESWQWRLTPLLVYNCQVILVFSLTLGFVGTFPCDVSETLLWVECERHCPHSECSNPTHTLRAAQTPSAVLSGGDGLRVTWWDVSVNAAGLWEARVAKLLPGIPQTPNRQFGVYLFCSVDDYFSSWRETGGALSFCL